MRADARDFTELDRRHFAAVYDSRLSYTDEELVRLLTTVREDDPDLRRTLVVVASDHGEELGEAGRTDHTDSLADGAQHVPWIVAGGPVGAGQLCDRFTENIDIAPTLLALLGVPLPPGTRMDGRPQLDADGRLAARGGKAAVYYAWETYRAIRTRRHLLRENGRGSFAALRDGEVVLYRLDGRRRVPLSVEGRAARIVEQLRARLDRRLGRRERRFVRSRYEAPHTRFLVRPEFWRLDGGTPVSYVPIDAATRRWDLRRAGWLWTGRGVTVLHGRDVGPLSVSLAVPDGIYQVEVAARPIGPTPFLLGFARWCRESFSPETATVHVALGVVRTDNGRLSVTLPSAVALRRHIVGLRLLPAGAVLATEEEPSAEDEELRVRLQALGYVE